MQIYPNSFGIGTVTAFQYFQILYQKKALLVKKRDKSFDKEIKKISKDEDAEIMFIMPR